LTTAVLSIGLHAVALAVHLVSDPGAPAPAAPVAMPDEQVVYISIVTEPPPQQAAPDAQITAPMDAGEFADITLDDPPPPDEEQSFAAEATPPEAEAPPEPKNVPESVPEPPTPTLSALKMPKKPRPPQPAKPPQTTTKTAKPRLQAASASTPAPALAAKRPSPRPAAPEGRIGTVAQTANAPPRRTQATFPRYLRNPPPAYPKAELRRRREGLVILTVTVGADGRATTVSVGQSSGIAAFDRAARDAVKRWRFVPATVDGRPVDGIARVPVRFALTQ